MYTSGAAGIIKSNNFFVAGIKLYELVKNAFKPAFSLSNSSKEYLPYILNSLANGYTVLDVGYHKKEYIFDLFKISKLPGRHIVFETARGNYNYFLKRKQLMKLENIAIEDVFLSEENKVARSFINERKEGAPVIHFDTAIKKKRTVTSARNTIDNYCQENEIVPALIKFKLEKDLGLLMGAKQTLKNHKPKVLIECCEGTATRETMLTLFKFLTELKYAGYFILDTIKVPLANFDFNTYQNEVLGYYCNNFIFE